MLCRYIFLCALLVTSAAVFLEANYGKYVVKVITYAVQNYKPFVKVAVDHEVLQNGSSTMTYHCVVLKDLGVFGIKIRWFSWDETLKRYSQAMNIVMRNICEKQLAKEILSMFKGLGKDCKVKHGVYNISVIDLNGLMHIVMRDKFFYGKYRTITDVFTEKYGRVLKVNLTLGVDPI